MKTIHPLQHRRGFTLIELVTGTVLVMMVVLIVGTLMVYGQKHWTTLFGRVYRQEAVDTFTVHRAFDSICRKATYRKAVLGSNNRSLELYYWQPGSTAAIPEHYARFYLSGTDFMIEYGRTRPDAWLPDDSQPVRQFTAATRVADVRFELQGQAVQMILHYLDDTLPLSICSSVRHNF